MKRKGAADKEIKCHVQLVTVSDWVGEGLRLKMVLTLDKNKINLTRLTFRVNAKKLRFR